MNTFTKKTNKKKKKTTKNLKLNKKPSSEYFTFMIQWLMMVGSILVVLQKAFLHPTLLLALLLAALYLSPDLPQQWFSQPPWQYSSHGALILMFLSSYSHSTCQSRYCCYSGFSWVAVALVWESALLYYSPFPTIWFQPLLYLRKLFRHQKFCLCSEFRRSLLL